MNSEYRKTKADYTPAQIEALRKLSAHDYEIQPVSDAPIILGIVALAVAVFLAIAAVVKP